MGSGKSMGLYFLGSFLSSSTPRLGAYGSRVGTAHQSPAWWAATYRNPDGTGSSTCCHGKSNGKGWAGMRLAMPAIAAAPAKEPVNYLIRVVEWKEPKADPKSLEVLTTEGNFELDTIQKNSVKINNNDAPVQRRSSSTARSGN